MDRQELTLSLSKQKMKPITGSILLVVFIICCLPGKTQNEKDSASNAGLKSFLKFEVGFYIGPTWEQRIGKNSALQFMAGIGIGGQTDKVFDFKAHFIITPTTLAEYRNYYNLNKRIAFDKITKNNSANFLYGRVQTYYAIKNQNYFGLLFIQGWGLQRSINKKLGFDFHFGIVEHFYYDKPPYGGYNYLRIEPEVMTSVFYIF